MLEIKNLHLSIREREIFDGRSFTMNAAEVADEASIP
jgi:hypothetical protein